jgi:hypothetical protein
MLALGVPLTNDQIAARIGDTMRAEPHLDTIAKPNSASW